MDWLFIPSEWRDLLGAMLAVAFLATLAHAVYRRFVAIDLLKGHHDVAGFIAATVGVLYAVVLGFVVITAWSTFDGMQRTADLEAGDIGDAMIFAKAMPEPERSHLIDAISEYAREVRYREFPALVQGRQDSRTATMLDDLLGMTSSAGTGSPEETRNVSATRQNIVESLRSAADRERFLGTPSHLPSGMYLALVAGGLIVLVFVFFFGVENSLAQLTMTALLSGMIGLLMALVVDLDHPYSGAFHVSSEAWALLVERDRMDDNAPIPVRRTGNSLAAIKNRGTLIVGVGYDKPLMGYLDTRGGIEPTGFDVDIARAVGRQILGATSKIEFLGVVPSNFVRQVQSGNVDMFVAAATITPKRLTQIDFSNVYYRTGQTLLVKTNSSIAGDKDLRGKSVAAVRRSTSEQTIRRLAPEARVETFFTNIDGFQALLEGRVDAMTSDEAILGGFQSLDRDSVKVVGGLFTFEPYGIGEAKGNASLASAVNDALAAIAKSGEYEQIYKKWFRREVPADWKDWYGMPATRAALMYQQGQPRESGQRSTVRVFAPRAANRQPG